MARCWLVHRFHELKTPASMDFDIPIFLISARCVALRSLDLLVKPDWSVVFYFVAENAGREKVTTVRVDRGFSPYGVRRFNDTLRVV